MSRTLVTVALVCLTAFTAGLVAGQSPTCNVDADCAPSTCCSPSTCVPASQRPDCSATACLAGCVPGTLDCGGSCYCSAGQCQARLNNITWSPLPVPVADECSTDADCGPSECCHPTKCAGRPAWPDCAAVSCTAECAAGTLDCGGSCSCVSGKCLARLNGPPTVPIANATGTPTVVNSSNTTSRDILLTPATESSFSVTPSLRFAGLVALLVLGLML